MKKIALLLISLMIVSVGFLSGCYEQSDSFINSSSGTCYYDWEATTTYHIGTYYSSLNEYQYESNTGYKFAVVTLAIRNNANQKINTNPWNWEMKINGVTYTHHTSTYDDSIGHVTVDVGKGGSFQTKLVYEIPIGATSASLIYTGFSAPYMKVDETLIPDEIEYDDTDEDEETDDEEFELSSHLKIVDSNAYSSSSYIYVFGIVKNIGNTNLRFVQLSCTLYDSSKNIIAIEDTYMHKRIIEPGEKSSFMFMIEEDYYKSYDIEILDATEVDCSDTIASGLYISNDYTEETSYGTIFINGKIKNIGYESADLVTIYALLYDSKGKIIGIAQTGSTEDGEVMDKLYSGQSEYFKIYVFDFKYAPNSEVASYELIPTHFTLFYC